MGLLDRFVWVCKTGLYGFVAKNSVDGPVG